MADDKDEQILQQLKRQSELLEWQLAQLSEQAALLEHQARQVRERIEQIESGRDENEAIPSNDEQPADKLRKHSLPENKPRSEDAGGSSSGKDAVPVPKPKRIRRYHPLELDVRDGDVNGPAELSKCPRTLQLLWREFKSGLEGNKPAEMITTHERNGMRRKYYRRNVVWSVIGRLVDAGWTSEEAIERIYAAYGHDASVTTIIEQMVGDKTKYQERGGFNPKLHDKGCIGFIGKGHGKGVLCACMHRVRGVESQRRPVKSRSKETKLELGASFSSTAAPKKRMKAAFRPVAAMKASLSTSKQHARGVGPACRHQDCSYHPPNGGVPFQTQEVLTNGSVSGPAKLSKNPRTLHKIWHEYKFGLDGSKPAELFTAKERSACRQKYYRRNVIWSVVHRLVLAGWNSEAAIERIYTVYGRHASVTTIMDQMVGDKSKYQEWGGFNPRMHEVSCAGYIQGQWGLCACMHRMGGVDKTRNRSASSRKRKQGHLNSIGLHQPSRSLNDNAVSPPGMWYEC